MANIKMSAIPPKVREVEIKREKFIKEAESTKSQPIMDRNAIKPWEDERVRADIRKAFTINLPEPYILKIKYISEVTNKSQQKIARETLCFAIDALIENLISEQ
jgi:hypothetical protein